MNARSQVEPDRAAEAPVTKPPARRRSGGKSGCALESALAVLGGRWKGVVLYWLMKRAMRFGGLRRALPNCTQRMLTLQLRELEEDGLVERTVFPEVPPRVEYRPSPFGKSLEPILRGLHDWGERHRSRLP